jgi:4-oxalocrotonate tautomerase
MAQGRTAEKKEELIKKMTDVIVETLRVPAERVRIFLYELPKENIAFNGIPISKMDN